MAKCKNHAKREWPTNRQCGELNGVQLFSFELLLRKVLFVLSVYSISYRNVQGEVESPGQSNVYSIKSFESNIEGSLSRKSKAPGVFPNTRGLKKEVSHEGENLTSCRA
jgi:hypothetical protein